VEMNFLRAHDGVFLFCFLKNMTIKVIHLGDFNLASKWKGKKW